MTSRSGAPIDRLVLVDAQHGTVALTIDQIEHAKNRTVCDAANANAQVPCTAPIVTEADLPGAGDNADVAPAFEYAGDTYDFFAGLGRDSLDDNGMTLKSTVRYCDPSQTCPYKNAFWNGEQMVYGEGYAAADDVVGHELTHGVTEFSSHLFYYYQSGAINESLSDVFGELIDQTNGAGNDTAEVKWLLGEDIPGVGAIRDMETPGAYGDPDRMTSPNYTADASEIDAGGVHTNSGVNNKAAFLITDGGTFNGRTVTGLGAAKTARIYYEVETAMLTSASDYADLGSALPQACTNLVGTAGITAADCTEVARRRRGDRDGDLAAGRARSRGARRAPAGSCPRASSPTTSRTRPAANWSAGADWYNPQNPNPYVGWDPTYATSGTKNLWGDDPYDDAGTSSISMTRSVAIPSGRPAYLRFNHAYGFGDYGSTAYDGGVLEISTNGGASYSDAGPLLTDVGYNGHDLVRATTTRSRAGPRSSQESNGYRSTRATLSSLAGQSVRFRFTTALAHREPAAAAGSWTTSASTPARRRCRRTPTATVCRTRATPVPPSRRRPRTGAPPRPAPVAAARPAAAARPSGGGTPGGGAHHPAARGHAEERQGPLVQGQGQGQAPAAALHLQRLRRRQEGEPQGDPQGPRRVPRVGQADHGGAPGDQAEQEAAQGQLQDRAQAHRRGREDPDAAAKLKVR